MQVIILDTNVVSALMVDEPEPAIAAWLDQQSPESVWTTTVTIFELRVGIEWLPASRKRRKLEDEFARVVHEDLQGRVLSFDIDAAHRAVGLSARPRRRGAPVEIRDTMIAGIAISRKAQLATRNIRHFGDLDVPVIDPWVK